MISQSASLSLVPVLLGGVGLFLLGMILMSDGLKAAAGGALRRVLERSTGTTWAAFLSGAGLTALVQSSSATTIATIGFVSAGLLSFPSALGVIIGSNVGTTSTGWIVSLLGLKLNVGAAALPLIGVGALLRLLTSGRRASLGMALAGFGLIFVGIDVLQSGMGDLARRIDLSGLSDASWAGRLLLVLAGAALTVLLQSSSAAVALSLTALHGGAIALSQAVYLVIGQNLGTTVTAILASAGASNPAQRTALAHVFFNATTGVVALLAAGPLLALVAWLARTLSDGGPAVTLALFHTVFNLLGAALFLPFTGPFARAIVRLRPDRGPALSRHLDRSLLHLPPVAIEAAGRALREIALVALAEAERRLRGGQPTRPGRDALESARSAIQECRLFLGRVLLDAQQRLEYRRRLELLHASDHLSRLLDACRDGVPPLPPIDPQAAGRRLADEFARAGVGLRSRASAESAERTLELASARQAGDRKVHRARLLAEIASGRVPADAAESQMEAMRWIDRVGYHAWRATHHLAGTGASGEPAGDSEVHEDPEPEPGGVNTGG